MSDAFASMIMEDAARALPGIEMGALSQKRVMLTGANGLIGVHVLAALILAKQRGLPVEVVAVIRRDPPAHLAAIFAGADRILRGSLVEADFRRSLPDADCIIHAAGSAQPSVFMADPVTALSLSTEASFDLLRRTRAGGSFLFVSSAEVYSGLQGRPLAESEIGTTTPSHPRASYIEGKRCGEAICHAFRSRGVIARVARVGHTYGPGARAEDQRVLPQFITKALLDGRIVMRDDGRVRRGWCYVADVAQMLLRVALEATGDVYNLGGVSGLSVRELAEMIGRQLGVAVEVPAHSAPVAGAPVEVELDMGRYWHEFGAPAYLGMEEGVSQTIRWHRGLLGR